MLISIVNRFGDYPDDAKSQIFLTWDNWNDYAYRTLFGIFYIDENSNKHELGGIKIGFYGQAESETKLEIGEIYDDNLPPIYFSLGSEGYYEQLNKLDKATRERILAALNDIARFPEIYERAINENVTRISLLRGVSDTEVTGQLRRMARGGSRLTPYEFQFQSFLGTNNESLVKLYFNVKPESNPPTNVNILIGRNGSGKTTVINNMVNSLRFINREAKYGTFSTNELLHEGDIFPNLVFVSFSAFDSSEFEEYNTENSPSNIKYTYIGLKKNIESEADSIALKTPLELKNEFLDGLVICKNDLKADRWKNAIVILESDPNFKDADIISLIEVDSSIEDSVLRERVFREKASKVFDSLSSGHKIVLLTISRLVETLEEKSLVLIDEPETHLHPPLLSAFTRSLSELLINRNGVAIIATHSPVILQEVPRNCVWKLRRNGVGSITERLEIESFGENVGVLTQSIFNLEVTDSGFHKMLREAMENTASYEDAVALFNNEIGLEGRAILRSLFYRKDRSNEINS